MSSKQKWMPSPAMVVAVVALFVALGGTALAFHLGKNAVKSKNIKPGAVHTSDLHRRAVKSAKVADGAIKGRSLAARSVGTAKLVDGAVGNAQLDAGAVTAGKIGADAVIASKIATGAVGADQLAANSVGNPEAALSKVFTAGVVPAAASLGSAPRVTLGSVGPFEFYGKCFLVGGQVKAAEYVDLISGTATLDSAGGAAFDSNLTGYLRPTTLEGDRELESVVTAEPDSFSADSGEEAFQASASDGTQITGLAAGIGAKVGDPPAGDGPFASGDSCILGSLAVFGS